jgi:hypothetical protein
MAAAIVRGVAGDVGERSGAVLGRGHGNRGARLAGAAGDAWSMVE